MPYSKISQLSAPMKKIYMEKLRHSLLRKRRLDQAKSKETGFLRDQHIKIQ